MCRVDPRIDFAFKKLFGSEENKDILIDLINSIVSEEDRVQDLVLKNPYNEKASLQDKLSVLDIKAQDENGNWFDIEMQIISQLHYEKRALYYWARLYNDQLEAGRAYRLLTKTICINILNFDCLDEPDYHNVYKIFNTKSQNQFFTDFEIHFIELNKFKVPILSFLDRWVAFLKEAGLYSETSLPKELVEIPTIFKAFNILERMNFTNEERYFYEAGLKAYRDKIGQLEAAKLEGIEEGLQKGIEEGLQKGIEEGLQKGIEEGVMKTIISIIDVLDDETIANKTGVSIDKIRIIRADAQNNNI